MKNIVIALFAVAGAGCANDPWAIQNYAAVAVQARKAGAADVARPPSPAPEPKAERGSN